MISLAALRIAGFVVAAVTALGVLYYVADLIGDVREAKVRAEYEAAIDDANTGTAAANAAASKVAERDGRVRAQALAAATAALTGKCLLTAAEATALTRVH